MRWWLGWLRLVLRALVVRMAAAVGVGSDALVVRMDNHGVTWLAR